MTGHGRYDQSEPPWDVILSDDPDLALVNADMHAWLLAHPCDCEALL